MLCSKSSIGVLPGVQHFLTPNLTNCALLTGVHFIMIGAYELQPQPAPYTSTNMLISSTQINWIIDDLAAVDRSVTPWIVAMFHPRKCTPSFNATSQQDVKVLIDFCAPP
jgi:hypothetical protein